MVTTEAPLGRVIYYIHKHPELVNQVKIFKRAQRLIDLISYLTKKKGVIEASNELLDDILKLRFDILRSTDLFKEIFANVNTMVENIIETQLNSKPTYLDLEKAFISSLEIYKVVTKSIVEVYNNQSKIEIPNYDDFGEFKNSLDPDFKEFFSSYYHASLMLDYSFLTADLVFTGELKLSNKNINELTKAIKVNTEMYGAFSAILGLWEIPKSNTSPWIRNIQIITSRMTVNDNYSLNKGLSVDDLKYLFQEV